MRDKSTPKPYGQWRTSSPADRGEDAASTFGYYLMKHCRAEALKSVQSAPMLLTRKQHQQQVEEAVDVALHNVMDLLEGYWPTDAGPEHAVEFALMIKVKDASGKEVESVRVSPCFIDLPIGYWKWQGGEF